MMAKNDWEVELSGDLVDLEQLTTSFADQDLMIIEKEGKYYLKSSRFESIDDSNEVREISKELATMITGATRLVLGSKSQVRVGGIYKIDGQKRSVYVEMGTPSASGRVFSAATFIKQDGTVKKSYPADLVKNWVQVASEDPVFNDVLELLSAENQDYVNLYKIYELIEHDVKGPAEMARIGGVSKADLSRFTQTANSRAASGIEARHGIAKYDPPKNPMSINEARAMIFKLAEAWLNTKG